MTATVRKPRTAVVPKATIIRGLQAYNAAGVHHVALTMRPDGSVSFHPCEPWPANSSMVSGADDLDSELAAFEEKHAR